MNFINYIIKLTILQKKLNLEFLLDGGGVKSSCFKHRWMPWVYTWITGDDPSKAFYSNNIALG